MHWPNLIIATAAWAAVVSSTAAPASRDGGGRFEPLPAIPVAPRQEHTTVRLTASTLAILGGIVPMASAPYGVITTNLMQIYNVTSRTWKRVADLPVALNHPNVAAAGGKLYLLGGLAPDVKDGSVWNATGNSWAYDPATDKWHTLAPTPRGFEAGSAAVGVHDHLIVLAGGLRSLIPGVEGAQDTVDSVVAYDFGADAWRMMPAQARTLPEGRDHAGAAVVNGTLYIVGGRRRGQNNVRDTVFALDLTCMSTGWKVKGGRMPTARGGLSAAAIGKTIYTFGGEGNPEKGSRGVFSQVEAYDTTADSWRKLSNMSTPRHGTYAVAVRGAVYIPGGGNQQGAGPISLHEAFYP